MAAPLSTIPVRGRFLVGVRVPPKTQSTRGPLSRSSQCVWRSTNRSAARSSRRPQDSSSTASMSLASNSPNKAVVSSGLVWTGMRRLRHSPKLNLSKADNRRMPADTISRRKESRSSIGNFRRLAWRGVGRRSPAELQLSRNAPRGHLGQPP